MRRTVASILVAVLLAFGFTAAAAVPASAKTLPKYSVKLSVTSTKSPIAASWVKFAGSTSKKLHGTQIAVQSKHGKSKWTKVASAKVAANGKFTARARATGVGEYSYRASVPVTKKHRGATSSPVNVTVFKYYYLSDLKTVSDDGIESEGAVTVAGTTYFHSVDIGAWWGTSYGEWNLSYKCTQFNTTVGPTDSTSVTYSSHNAVLLDGTEVNATDNTVGHSSPVTVDTTGSFRLRIESTYEKQASFQDVGWGDAQILCSGKP